MAAILLCLPVSVSAQGVWETPDDASTKITEKETGTAAIENVNPDAKYLQGAVTETDGKVCWTLTVDIPGKTAQQLYDKMLNCLNELTHEEGQIEGSKVSLVNKDNHKIVANMKEWLVFSSTLLALDRAKMNYNLFVECTDGRVKVEMTRISYVYNLQHKQNIIYKAEEWITDKYAMNKKKTRLYRPSGKFRRKTIDRKDEIFSIIREKSLE